MQAADEVHGEPGVFQKPDEFPRAGHGEFPLSPEAGRYYKSGKPFLQRYLPFWATTLIDRTVVMLFADDRRTVPADPLCAADLRLAGALAHLPALR
jgi:hypothetical protein